MFDAISLPGGIDGQIRTAVRFSLDLLAVAGDPHVLLGRPLLQAATLEELGPPAVAGEALGLDQGLADADAVLDRHAARSPHPEPVPGDPPGEVVQQIGRTRRIRHGAGIVVRDEFPPGLGRDMGLVDRGILVADDPVVLPGRLRLAGPRPGVVALGIARVRRGPHRPR